MARRKSNSLALDYPELAKQWHPTKNGNLTPYDVSSGSDIPAWWLIMHYDSRTGKYIPLEWQTRHVKDRTSGGGKCPYLSGRKVLVGFNDLATENPEVAAEWYYAMNGDKKPTDFTAGSNEDVYWIKSYDDPKTGKHFEFVWHSTIKDRTRKAYDCPFLSGHALWTGFNDLCTTNPDLVAEWHPTKNGDRTPYNTISGSSDKVWWFLPYDDPKSGKHFDFVWDACVKDRAKRGDGCPFLSGHAAWPGFNDLATTHPDLAAEWHPTKNGKLTPQDFTAGSGKYAYWLKRYLDRKTGKVETVEIYRSIKDRVNGNDGVRFAMSSGEKNVKRWLDKNNIEYCVQKKFSGLLGLKGRELSFDFAIQRKDTLILIEYQGRQHYGPVEMFGGDNAFVTQQEHDRRKREFAARKGYVLIEINYEYDTSRKVSQYLDEHLLPLLQDGSIKAA